MKLSLFVLFTQILSASAAVVTVTVTSTAVNPKCPPTPVPPTPYEKCLKEHDGKSEFKINNQDCKCMTDGS
ncbi:hypothetical protein BB558_005731, partial [Smittium angustum]